MTQAGGLTTSKHGSCSSQIENAIYFQNTTKEYEIVSKYTTDMVGRNLLYIYIYISLISLVEARDVKGFLVLEGNGHILPC